MLCVSDESIFLPCPKSTLLGTISEHKKQIITVLDLIQNSFNNTSCKDSNKFFTAINAGYLLTKGSGGKFLIFNASQSMINLPRMKSSKVTSIPKDEVIYTPTDDSSLKTMGINLSNEHISCDMFIAAETFTVSLSI
jgi:hypothetical protein